MTVRLVDIAEHLGISVSTVSRVINGKDRVKDETRKRVLEAVEELQYRPNEIARSLRYQNSMTIAVIVPDLSNNFFNLLTKGAATAAKEDNYLTILCNSDYDQKMEQEYMNLLVQKQVDGVILATVCKEKDYFENIITDDMPVVFVDNLPDVDLDFNYVTIDNERAAYDLTAHLIQQGYEDIAVLTGSLHETSAVKRLQGWENAMKSHDMTINQQFIGVGDFRIESGYNMMASMLNRRKRPDAVLAANNYLAYGAIRAAQDKGLLIPDDLYVVCFDAVDKTGLININIPSIIQPAQKIGEVAAETLVKRFTDKNYTLYDNIILEPIFKG
ncbi:MAG: LacI family DNA-binding transcriptional regulator [Clostridia bacterium]|nr:LacI family DNA-binding transcriptional regulator [Clostridia bacterium]